MKGDVVKLQGSKESKELRLEQNMLDMTKIEDRSLKLDKEKIDLIQNIQHVINDFGNESSNKKIQLIFPQPSEPVFINADKVRISEVISNLLGNAMKFHQGSRRRHYNQCRKEK